MGASLEIFGVNNKKLIEDYPGYFKSSQEVSVEELEHLYYEVLFDKKNCGLELFFENGIRRYCSTINQMMLYFFGSFDWNGDVKLDHYDHCNYKLSKDQVVDLMDWFTALYYVFSEDKETVAGMKEPKYLQEAKAMIDHFESEPDERHYFVISWYNFPAVKEEILKAHYDWYFLTYSQ